MWSRALVVLVAATAGAAHARPGTRSLPLELLREDGRLAIGDFHDRLPAASLRLITVDGKTYLSADVPVGKPAPTRWSISLERLNDAGFVVARELPILGAGLPPLATPVDVPPPGEHLRARLSIDCGRFEGAETPPVVVPPLPEPPPAAPPTISMIIDGKEARLPLDRPRVTFDLDVPATVVIKVQDALGARWLRRSISETTVKRPAARPPPPLAFEPKLGSIRVGGGLIPIPSERAVLLGSSVEGGRLSVRVEASGEPVCWRLRFGGGGGEEGAIVGLGRPPGLLELAVVKAPTWVELELQGARGTRSSSGAVRIGSEGPRGLTRVLSSALAGDVTRVGSSTSTQALLAIPEDF